MQNRAVRSLCLLTKQARNAFLQRNRLCITGRPEPLVLDAGGHPIGEARQCADGSYQVNILEQFIGRLCEQDRAQLA